MALPEATKGCPTGMLIAVVYVGACSKFNHDSGEPDNDQHDDSTMNKDQVYY